MQYVRMLASEHEVGLGLAHGCARRMLAIEMDLVRC